MFIGQLRYLTALAHERHFGRAAATCHVSQPALSAAIRKLEEELGVPIVQRRHRFEGFTPEGERVLQWAARILADYDSLGSDLEIMRDGFSGRLRVGAIPTTVPTSSLVTGPFREHYPRASVLIKSLTSRQIERELEEFELDAGLTYLDNEPLHHVRGVPLYVERYVLLTPADERFEERATVTWYEAAQLPLCLLSGDMQNRRILDGIFERVGTRPQPVVESSSISALYSHVRNGGLASVMAHAWMHLFEVPPGMRAIPLVEPEAGHTIGLVVHDRRPEQLLAGALLEVARELDLQPVLDALIPA